MRSQTQRDLTLHDVTGLVRRWLGPGPAGDIAHAQELGGGGFAAVWQVTLADGRTVVLKTSPPPHATLLTYESGLLAAEAEYFERLARDAPDLPVPRVLYHHGSATHTTDGDCGTATAPDTDAGIDGDWMVMTLLPGAALSSLRATLSAAEDHAVRADLGRTVARLHTLTGPHFGYPGPGRRRGASWREVYLGIIEDLLADAGRLGADLPLPAAEIRRVIGAGAPVLDDVVRPAPVHFDLWDGNVLTSAGTLTGLVDGERWLYADRLVDFTGPALFGHLERDPGHPFLAGYAQVHGELRFTASEVLRIALYRAWLYLVMVVEVPTRGLDRDEHAENREGRLRRLGEVLADVAALTPAAGVAQETDDVLSPDA